MSPKPDQVPREKALDNPTKNRSEDFLPGERERERERVVQLLMFLHLSTTADRWRVVLKGETEDYIHAVAVNVSGMLTCGAAMF